MARWTRALGRGPLEVEELLRSMRSSQVEINDFHQCTAMSSYTCKRMRQRVSREKSSAWPRALRTVGVSSDAARANAALRAWAAGGSWAAAISFLSDLKDLKTDTISFNSSMAALSHAPHWPQVLELLRWMQHEGLLPSAVSLHYAVGMASWASALALLEGMRGVRRTEVTCTAVLGGLRAAPRRRRWPLAVGFLEAAQWSPSLLSQEGRNAALSLVASCGRWALALHAALHAAADVVSFSTAISACEQAGRWQLTWMLLELMWDRKVKVNNFSYNAAMSACAKSTAWRKALELFEAMPRLRVEQDVVSHNALLEACVQKETAAGAGVEEILASMNEALILPNLISYSTALMAFEKEGRWEEGLQLLRRMRQTLLQLDVICYNSAMSACKVASQWQAAWQLLRPSETTVAGFSALCAASRCQWRAALRAVELALGAGRATVVMYASTLEAASCAAACAASAGASVASVWLMHSLEEAAWDLRCQAQKE